MVLNTEKLKRFNVDLIRTAIKSKGTATKSNISFATGLSIATCNNILNELIVTGEVQEIEEAESTGGRPSKKFIYNKNFIYIAALYGRIEKGEKSIHCSVFNMSGESVYDKSEIFPEISVDELVSVIKEILTKFDKIKVVSLGVPGIVRKGVIGLCELEKLSHSHMKRHLEKKFNKIFTISNDVNCAALGYYHSIKNKSLESLVYMYYAEDGLSGAGIIINGRILQGSRDFAGEISFLPLGVKIEKQGQIQKNQKKFLDLVNRTVQSVTCIINPEYIVISGHWFTDEMKEQLLELINKTSPIDQISQIIFESGIHKSYLKGLYIAAIQNLHCGFEVISTR
ncbi:MAG: ROK family protein [Spirochaetaceae bacterium]|nr:ROK family protein [Spirochaetaceae bacterium]